MARGLLFDQTYFYENTEVDENTDWKLLRPSVWDAQELYIQDIIGSPLYNEIKTQIVASTLTGLNTTLVDDYLAPCLLKYVMTDAQVSLLYKYRNKSVLKDRSDSSNPIDFKEHRYLKDFYQMKAERYAEKVERYLCANSTSYPLYTTYTTSDEVRAHSVSNTVSVYLGDIDNDIKTGFDFPT